MAYNGFYPGGYVQQYAPQYQQPTSNFVAVRSIEEAYNWPVAPGNSITFKDENQPFVYTKTKGFSPLEQPVFERYKLVKVEETPTRIQKDPVHAQSYDEQIKQLWEEVNQLKSKIGGTENDKPTDDHAD